MLLVAGGQGLRWMVGLVWPIDHGFVFYHLAVLASALTWGLGPGLLSVAASALASLWFHETPIPSVILFLMGDLVVVAVVALGRLRWRRAGSIAATDRRRLTQLVNALPDLVSYVDCEGRYQYNNEAYERWFGVPPDRLRGRHMRDVLGDEAYEVIRPHFEAAMAGREVTYETFAPYKTGGRHIQARYLPYRSTPRGAVEGFFVLVSDISGRHHAREQLEARVRQQEAVARLGQAALGRQAPEGLIQKAIDEVCAVLGSEYGAVIERRTEEDVWIPHATVGWDCVQGRPLTTSDFRPTQSAYALERGEPVLLEDARTETRFEVSSAMRERGIVSGMTVPIAGEGGAWGVLTTHSTRERGFTQDDIHFMQAVAHVLSESIRRQDAENSLRESEERFRMMADTAPALIWVAGTSNEGVYFNRPWLHFTGRTLEQESGDGWIDGIHPGDRDEVASTCSAAFGNRQPFRVEFRLRRHDGVWRWVLDHGVPRFDHAGRFLGYIGSMVDITDRRRAQEELEHRLDQLSAIYEVSDVAGRAVHIEEIYEATLSGLMRAVCANRASILLFDPDGVMRFKAWSGLSDGYRQRATGHSPWTKDTVDPEPVTIPDAAAGEQGPLGEAILKEGIRALGFVPLIAAGRLIGKFVIYYDAPHTFTDEELRVAATIGRHVSGAVERWRADKELRALNETLEMRVQERTGEGEHRAVQLRALALDLIETEERERRLLAQSLHDDLQQILVATRMKLGHLQGRGDGGALQPVQDLLHEALQSSRRIMLDLSPPILFQTGLWPALEWLTRHMREKYGLEVKLQRDREVDIPSERHRAFLFRAAREMLFNVVKHSGVSTAALRLDQVPDGAVALEVTDEGRGFQQARLQATGAAGGFGLLSIQERAEALGGALEVHSERGHGTRARLTLTIHERAVGGREPRAAVAVATQEPEPPAEGRAGRIRVLLADDHKIVREGLAALLSAEEDIETVAQAADGEEAVSLAMRLRPDVVIMDVNMPKLSGIEATRRITAQAPSIKVIGLSMFESEEMSLSMKTAGASSYLTKDRASETLCDLIRVESGRVA